MAARSSLYNVLLAVGVHASGYDLRQDSPAITAGGHSGVSKHLTPARSLWGGRGNVRNCVREFCLDHDICLHDRCFQCQDSTTYPTNNGTDTCPGESGGPIEPAPTSINPGPSGIKIVVANVEVPKGQNLDQYIGSHLGLFKASTEGQWHDATVYALQETHDGVYRWYNEQRVLANFERVTANGQPVKEDSSLWWSPTTWDTVSSKVSPVICHDKFSGYDNWRTVASACLTHTTSGKTMFFASWHGTGTLGAYEPDSPVRTIDDELKAVMEHVDQERQSCGDGNVPTLIMGDFNVNLRQRSTIPNEAGYSILGDGGKDDIDWVLCKSCDENVHVVTESRHELTGSDHYPLIVSF